MVRENGPKSPIRPSCPNLCPQKKRKDEEILARTREKKVALSAAMMTESGKSLFFSFCLAKNHF